MTKQKSCWFIIVVWGKNRDIEYYNIMVYRSQFSSRLLTVDWRDDEESVMEPVFQPWIMKYNGIIPFDIILQTLNFISLLCFVMISFKIHPKCFIITKLKNVNILLESLKKSLTWDIRSKVRHRMCVFCSTLEIIVFLNHGNFYIDRSWYWNLRDIKITEWKKCVAGGCYSV